MDVPMSAKQPGNRAELPVWFYIGALLTAYGFLLSGAGIYQFSHPPKTVLANYHATFWGGILLLALGITYVVIFWPRPHKVG
jgi:hypothetical protein